MIMWCISTAVSTACIVAAMIYGWGLYPKSWGWMIFWYAAANVGSMFVWAAKIKIIKNWEKKE